MRAALWVRVVTAIGGFCLTNVSLLVFATAPPALVPNSLSYSSQIVNTTSAAQSIALRNRQGVPLSVSSIAVTGDFAQTNNCPIAPQTLAKDTGCTITITFTPTALGARTGTLTVVDNASNSPQIATLSGTGTLSGLSAITVVPAVASINTATQQQFTATGLFSGGVTSNITAFVAWKSTNTTVAGINATGLATGLVSGSTSIQASSGAIVGSGNLTVTAILQSITVTPAGAAINKGQTQQFTAMGNYSDGTTQNLTTSVSWSSSASAVATISGIGLATGTGVGSSTITATSGAVSGFTTLTV
ncbi:MAG TPA: Ig-like domain-containing protein, partial [Terriglobales bacterium]|nr:Ig-like domain-containing protein [Terriglobales bacterium]